MTHIQGKREGCFVTMVNDNRNGGCRGLEQQERQPRGT